MATVWFKWSAGKTNLKVDFILEEDGRRWGWTGAALALVDQNTIVVADFGSESKGVVAATEKKLSDNTTGTGWYSFTWPTGLTTAGLYRVQLYIGTPVPDGEVAFINLYWDGSKIVGPHNVGFTANEKSKLEAIHIKLPSKTFLTGTENSDGDIEMNHATGNFGGTVAFVSSVGDVVGNVMGHLVGDVLGEIANMVDANIVQILGDPDMWELVQGMIVDIKLITDRLSTMQEIIGAGPSYRFKADALSQGPAGEGLRRFDPKLVAAYDDSNKKIRLVGWLHYNGELYTAATQAVFNIYKDGQAAPIASVTNNTPSSRFFAELQNMLLNPDEVYHAEVIIRDEDTVDHIAGIGIATLD